MQTIAVLLRLNMRLVIHIGGIGSTQYIIEYYGDTLSYWTFSYERNPDDQPEFIEPSQEQWDHFWKFMKQCDGWAERYKQPDTNEVTSWLVQVECGELSIWSSGSNDYPENFKRFLKEVRLLIGGKAFE